MSVVASHTARIDRDELERRLTWQDRLSIFRTLGFSIPENKVKSEGWIDGLRLPSWIHHDTKAGASVNLGVGGVKDHGGNGYSNDLIGLVEDKRSCTFQEALAWITDETGYQASTTDTRPKRRPQGRGAARRAQRRAAKIHPINTNGSTKADTPKKPDWNPFRDGVEVAVYSYTDGHGETLFEVVRFEVRNDHPAHPDKTFRQRRYDPTDPKADDRGYAWGMKGARLVPFRLPLVLEAIQDGEPIFIGEGEKPVLAVERLGLVATCNAGGAGKWTDEHSAHFKGADVVILPDNDPAGHTHAGKVAVSLSGIARSIKIVFLPGLPQQFPVKNLRGVEGKEELT